jgi:predicted acylesterase/phospholipase RssA
VHGTVSARRKGRRSGTAIVLGGGGLLGAAEVGMLAALVDSGVRPDLIVGTSIGAINGAAIAADPSAAGVDRLTQIWREVAASGLFAGSLLRTVGTLARTRTHLHSNLALRRLLEKHLTVRRIEDLAVHFECVAASIERAAEHWFTEGPLVDAVLASAAVPGILPPVRIGHEHFIDGGIVNSIPVGRHHLRLPRRSHRQQAAGAAASARGRSRRIRDRPPSPLSRRHERPAGRCPGARPAFRRQPAPGVRQPRQPALPRLLTARRAHRGRVRGEQALPRAPAVPVRLPPRWSRRAILQPLFIVLTLLLTVLSPILLLIAALVSPLVSGRWRPLRAALYTLLWMQREVVVILACLGIWLRAATHMDAPRTRARHYALMRWFLRSARTTGERLLGVTVQIDDDGTAGRVLRANDRPLIVLSRHSGPGDTLYLVDILLDRYGREPRVVMKEILKLDPCIDLAGSRVPNYFVPPPARRRDGSWEAEISALAAGLGERGALLLFPEGGNFSQARRRRRLVALLRRGRRRDAERAVRMHHVIAPQPGGALTAVAAAPRASVILIAHDGLSGLEGGGLMSRAPIDQVFRVKLWFVDRSDIPAGDEARGQWLLDCWERVDRWVAQAMTAVAT